MWIISYRELTKRGNLEIMGQQDIADLLKDKYPEYLTSKEISEFLNIGHKSITVSLSKMRRREEIQYKMIRNFKSGEWLYSYRINGEKENGKE